jgi:hypothetical protein
MDEYGGVEITSAAPSRIDLVRLSPSTATQTIK